MIGETKTMKIKFGCIYRRLNNYSQNEQAYGYYIPACWVDENNHEHWRMVDTFMVQPYATIKTLEQRRNFLLEANKGKSSYCIYWGPSNYYYSNYIQLKSDELDENDWEIVIDLTQCEKICPSSEVDEYETDDVTEKIPMYWEDSYSWYSGPGNYYVKPGRQKSNNAIAFGLRNKITNEVYLKDLNYETKYYYEALKEYCDENKLDPHIQRLSLIALEKFNAYKKAMDNLEKEYASIMEKYKEVD